jgi:serine phosphatase RsbU (regulator of sigma subunit)
MRQDQKVFSANRVQRVLFYTLCVVMLFICIVSFISAYSWLNKTFPGFYVYNFGRVGSMGSTDWPGAQSGLKFMDRIIRVNDEPVREGSEIVERARTMAPGTPIKYAVESKGNLHTVFVPTIKFQLKDFFVVFLVPFVGGGLIFCLGCIVYILKPDVYSNWIFFFFCLFLGIYIVTSIEMQSTYMFSYLNYFAIPLVPATLFHLCLVFPGKKIIISKHPILEYLIYLPALLLLAGYMIYLYSFSIGSTVISIPDIAIITSTNRIFYLLCLVGIIMLLIHALYGATSSLARQRARMIIFGVTFAFLPPVAIMLLVALFKVTFPWNFLVFFVIFFPASIAYSIVRHNLFDADAIMKRTVGYVVVTGIIVGSYAIVTLVLNVFFGQYQLAQSRIFPILFVLSVILVFNPLRNRIQDIVDRIFFRKEYDYGRIVEKIGSAITSLLDLNQVLRMLIGTFMEDMFMNTSSVMLLNPEGTAYQVYIADGERSDDVEKVILKQEDTLIEILNVQRKELTKYDIVEDPKYRGVSGECRQNFEALNSSLIVPLIYQDQVIGLLNLGEKKSGKFYNREDIDLLRTLAHQGAVAIENARLFHENLEKHRMEEELAIARELQTSMLPDTNPKIEGFEIASTSIPAREVGGDFYDFIDMGEYREGLIIGDVTGKSVSGALVMAASRSVFRMLSEEKIDVGEIMIRANKRAKKDIKSGIFIALLYAVLNSADKTLRFCNAGQTQPIMLPKQTGEAVFIETEGDTFPLGILDDVDYVETQIQLSPGDKVIFYTDGIVEAMNEQREIFGFDRLLDLVQRAHLLDAESILQLIMKRVNEFSGDSPQHDDLTVIVLSVLD